METLTVEKYNLLETIKTKDATIEKTKEKIAEIQTESAKQLQIQINGNKLLAETNIRLGKQIEEHKNQVKALTDSLQAIRRLSDEKSGDILELKAELSKLEDNLKIGEDNLTEAAIINNELQDENLKLTQEIFNIRKEARMKKSEYEEKLAALKSEIQGQEKLIASLTEQLTNKSPDAILRDFIRKGNGYVKKSDLESIDGAVFHKDGVVSFSHGGLVMRRNFLRDDYCLRE